MTKQARPLDDAAWADIRVRYEAGVEPVRDLAGEVGLSMIALGRKARDEGWVLRNRKKSGSARRKESTTATIRRLKDVLQNRVATLESEMQQIGADVEQLGSKRDIGAVGVLVRTLERVIDLERKHLAGVRKARETYRHFDEQQRLELAAKIEKLQDAWHGEPPVANPADQGRGGAE